MSKKEILSNGRINNALQIFGIKRYTLNGGAENGLRVIECVNGKLRFLLNESKALDIMQIFYEGQNLSFISKNGFTARETDFINRFEGGALYTCGLDSLGNVEGKPMHGSFHNIPAMVLRAECAEEGIVVEAEMRFSALFGQNLVMRRKIFSAYDSGKIEIHDVLKNDGTKTENYCLLYHVNLGYPFLSEGGKIIADIENVFTNDEFAEQKIDMWNIIEPPKDNEAETCYYITPKDNKVAYVNSCSGRKFTLTFCKELDKFLVWKSMASGDYALGLEPCTSTLDDNFAYKKIGVGESKSFNLTFTIE